MKIPHIPFPISLIVSALALVLIGPSGAVGQNATFTPYYGYRIGGTLSIEKGDLELDNADFLGGQLDFRVRPDATAAILVDFQPTTLRLREGPDAAQELFDMDVWYFQVGGTLENRKDTGAIPFFVGSLGMSMFDPDDDDGSTESEYGFAGVFGAGAKIPLQSGRMGLRLQARVLLNSVYGGSSLWCGTGQGCYVGAGGYLGPVQFDFGGGITFGGS